jgi:hypothetical protein
MEHKTPHHTAIVLADIEAVCIISVRGHFS